MARRVQNRSGPGAGLARDRAPLVLMYHSVAPYLWDPYQVTVRPERFDEQMRWLRRRGLTGVSVREILQAQRDGVADGLVGLTFDDGYSDFVEYVLPILRRYGFSATVFVLAGFLGGENVWDASGPSKPLLSVEQIGYVAASGIEIGSHGLRHVRLPEITPGQLRDEVVRSRTVLREVAGQDVPGFCYPYGDLAEPVVDAVRCAGYDYACAIKRSALTGRLALPRTYVGDRDGGLRLRAKRVRDRWNAAVKRGEHGRRASTVESPSGPFRHLDEPDWLWWNSP